MRLLKESSCYKVAPLCGLFGVTRQSFYQRQELDYEYEVFKSFIISYVLEVRAVAPRMGCEKLHVMCQCQFGDKYRIGRDAFYTLLRSKGLMLKIKKRKTRTTDSEHPYIRYKNLAKDVVPDAANQLWVADITYIWTSQGFCYLSLITDAYSHKIMGWILADSLKYIHTEEALRQAIASEGVELSGLIHHSDRGVQYAYPAYTDLLREHQIQISMTENGDPLENAVAERVNGILKQEWLSRETFRDIGHINTVLRPVIAFYNTRRPHASIDMLTPEEAHKRQGTLKRRWKNYYPQKNTTNV